jgi:phage terminase small subunit
MLKEKRKVFAAEYVKDWNATQAAIRAGYSLKTAYSQGQRLLKNVEVRAEIDRLSADIADQNDVEVREIIVGLRRIAFAPEGPQVNNSDRLRALELLGKYKAMFTDVQIQEPERKQRIDRNMAELARVIASKVITSKPLLAAASPSSTDKAKLTGLSAPVLPDAK